MSDTNEDTIIDEGAITTTDKKNNMWRRLSDKIEDLVIYYPRLVWAWNIIVCFCYILLSILVVTNIEADNTLLAFQVLGAMCIMFVAGVILFGGYCISDYNYETFNTSALIFPICAFFIGILGLVFLPFIFDIIGAGIGAGINVICAGLIAFASFITSLVTIIN